MRATRAAAKADMLEIGAAIGTAYVVGKLAQSGGLDRVPDVLGMPKTVTVAAVGKLIAYNVSGKAKQITNGLATGAACVAAYQFGNGQTVSGGYVSGGRKGGRSLASEEEIAKRLTEKIRDQIEDMQDVASYAPAE
jgi:hypothetical protein